VLGSCVVLLAVAEAAAASEEVKRLSEEVSRLTAELDDAHEQLSTVKASGDGRLPSCLQAG
jgi:chromosome segregation ATPase